MLAPAPADHVARFLDFSRSAAVSPPRVSQSVNDLPIPAFRGPITEQSFTFDNVPCAPELNPRISAVLHAASFAAGAVAPELIVSVFGSELAALTAIADTIPLPTTLAGTTMTLTDSARVERDMSLFFVSGGQINGMIPPGTALGDAQLIATTGQGETAVAALRIGGSGDGALRQTGNLPLSVAPLAPGLFAANATGQGVAAAFALRVKADNARTTERLFDDTLAPIPIDMGDTDAIFLLLFGTGIRGFSEEVRVRVGGEDVPVLGAVPQGGFAGLDQVNVGPLPRSLIGRGEVPIELEADGIAANVVTVTIQ